MKYFTAGGHYTRPDQESFSEMIQWLSAQVYVTIFEASRFDPMHWYVDTARQSLGKHIPAGASAQ
jgi:hypothetical protein